MRYKYKVRELSKDTSEDIEAMSSKKLKAKSAFFSLTLPASNFYDRDFNLLPYVVLFDNNSFFINPVL